MQALGLLAWRPASSTAARATAYLEGHVPGAAHADPETDLTGDDGGGRHPLPRAEAFAAWASAAGIGPETLVVGYDDGTGWAARLWWLLRHFGHDAAGVIPFDAWRGPLAHGAEEIAPRIFTPRAPLGRHRRRGGAPRPARGRVADARRRPGAGALARRDRADRPRRRPDPGCAKPFFSLSVAAPRGAPSPLPDLVVYCGSGVTACAVLHELHLAGRADARLYPGSFSEWYALGPVERDELRDGLGQWCARWGEIPFRCARTSS